MNPYLFSFNLTLSADVSSILTAIVLFAVISTANEYLIFNYFFIVWPHTIQMIKSGEHTFYLATS